LCSRSHRPLAENSTIAGENGRRRNTLEAQAKLLENRSNRCSIVVRDKNSEQFRSVVWNYTSEEARPVLYGVRRFICTELGPEGTRVHWTDWFRLNPNRFLISGRWGTSSSALDFVTGNTQR
jgi:hypothetical protein